MKGNRKPFAQRGWRLWLVVASFLFILKVEPILAHAELVTAEPAPGARLYQSPSQVRLTFGEPVTPDSTIVLFGNNFQMINGIQMLHDATMPEQLAATVPALSPGQYTVQWQAVSVDGDVVSGSYAFNVTGSFLDAVNRDKWMPSSIIIIFGLLLIVGAIRWRRKFKPMIQSRNRRSPFRRNMKYRLLVLVLSIIILTACTATNITSTPLPTATPDPVVLGQQVFARVCSVCHGENAEGYANALNAPALDETEHAYEHPDPVIHDWIVNGKLGLGRQMPALGEQLTDEEVHAVIVYLHTLWTEEQLTIQQDITSRYPATPEPTWTPEP